MCDGFSLGQKYAGPLDSLSQSKLSNPLAVNLSVVTRDNFIYFGRRGNSVAWNAGGGAMLFFGDHVGLRADVRYFRTFKAVVFDFIDDLFERDRAERVDFGRTSVGVVFRF